MDREQILLDRRQRRFNKRCARRMEAKSSPSVPEATPQEKALAKQRRKDRQQLKKNQKTDDLIMAGIFARLKIRSDPRLETPNGCSSISRKDGCNSNSIPCTTTNWDSTSLTSSLTDDWSEEVELNEYYSVHYDSITITQQPFVLSYPNEEVLEFAEEAIEYFDRVQFQHAKEVDNLPTLFEIINEGTKCMDDDVLHKYYTLATNHFNTMGLLLLRSIPYSRTGIPNSQRKFNTWFDRNFEFSIPPDYRFLLKKLCAPKRNTLQHCAFSSILDIIGKSLITTILTQLPKRYTCMRTKIKRTVWKLLLREFDPAGFPARRYNLSFKY